MNKNTTDSVKKSVLEFISNTEFVRSHVDFCDSLIEQGYNLKEAIEKTDEVFEILQQKETY